MPCSSKGSAFNTVVVEAIVPEGSSAVMAPHISQHSTDTLPSPQNWYHFLSL